MNPLVFVDIMRFSKNTFSELGITPVQNNIISDEDYIYNYSGLIDNHIGENKSGGWLMGKCLLRYNTADFDSEQYPYFTNNS